MKEKESFRLSITGIDGSGKDTIAKNVLAKAALEHESVVKLGRPAYEYSNGEVHQIFKHVTEGMDRVHQAADSKHSRRRIVAANALNVMVQSRVLEPMVSARTPAPDIIASSRDPRIDPAVYFSYYAPTELARQVGVTKRVETMQRLTAVRRDLIIMLRVDPRIAVERIEQRITDEEELKRKSGQNTAGMRDKWRHMHENVDDLSMLNRGYDVALEALNEVCPTAVVEIDTTEIPRDAVTDIAYYAISQAMDGNIGLGERLVLAEAS